MEGSAPASEKKGNSAKIPNCPLPFWGSLPGMLSVAPGGFAVGSKLRHQRETRSLAGSSFRRDQIETIEIHHFVPHRYEVFHKLLLRIGLCINFRKSSELGMRTEEQVYAGGGPLELARRAIPS